MSRQAQRPNDASYEVIAFRRKEHLREGLLLAALLLALEPRARCSDSEFAVNSPRQRHGACRRVRAS